MFQYHFKSKNSNKQTHPKEFYQEYIDTGRESIERSHDSMTAEIEVGLYGSIDDMRRDFKNTTKRILRQHSDKEPTESSYETTRA